jgi:peptidoglycan LD-endopeptidase LytH
MKFLKQGRTWTLVFILIISSCTTLHTFVSEHRTSPRATYLRGLEKSHLASTSMVRSWVRAGDVTAHDSIIVKLPFSETGFFASSELQARFYQFEAEDGQVLTLNAVSRSKESAKLFIDVFTWSEGMWREQHHADSSLNLTYEFSSSSPCLVRIQPELLANMYYSLSLSVTPVLMNPVKGASNQSIRSYWGDARDGGKRKHEGVDIFAPKGTEVIAPTDGVISNVGYNSLGGKVIWMNDNKRRHAYYFAHLDSQMVKAGMRVSKGETIGLVGNTGNAKRTPSHLHFGVYQKNAKDPASYIRTMEQLVNNLMPDTLFQSIVFRVNQKTSKIYSAPARKSQVRTILGKDNWVKVIGQSNDWYRVVTADHREGFVEKKQLVPAENGKLLILKEQTQFMTEASSDAIPMGIIEGSVENLASFENFRFIRTKEGLTGWVSLPTL